MGKKSSSVRNIHHFLAGIAAFLLGLTTLALLTSHLLSNSRSFCANSISCIKDLSGTYKPGNEATYLGKHVTVPPELPSKPPRAVLGETSSSNKHIYVDLSAQRLYAYDGDSLVYNFLVSTGKWYNTPTGDFRIWVKLRYTLMTGGNPAWGTYYYLPNVPFTMYFYNDDYPKTRGFGLHGTYWHSNFGHPMSHGCVNMKTEEAELLYNWVDPPTESNVTYASNTNLGTPVTIYGTTPVE